MDGLLDQDPFVKGTASTGTGTTLGTCVTGVVKKGGKNPVWTTAHGNTMSFQYTVSR